MKFIPMEKRDGCHCHICGATESVKYIVEVANPLCPDKKMEVYACNKCALVYANANEEMHIHYQLANGNLVSKARVDRARELLNSLMDGFTVTELADDELFVKGDKVEAVMRYHKKYNCGAVEEKAAIEQMRGKNI